VVFCALLISGFGTAAEVSSSPAVMLTLASLTAAVLLLAFVVIHRRFPPAAVAASVRWTRHRVEHGPFLRLRDPAAAGRPLPRAPTTPPRAA
jgi:hypothetical protein